MAHVMTTIVTPLSRGEGFDRPALLARCRHRRLAANAVGCNYWVFEQGAPSPALFEYFEARDEATLQRARLETDAWPDGHTILREVEL